MKDVRLRLVNYFRNTIDDDAVNRRRQTLFELICENKQLEMI